MAVVTNTYDSWLLLLFTLNMYNSTTQTIYISYKLAHFGNKICQNLEYNILYNFFNNIIIMQKASP